MEGIFFALINGKLIYQSNMGVSITMGRPPKTLLKGMIDDEIMDQILDQILDYPSIILID